MRHPIVIAVGFLLASPAWGEGWPDCNQGGNAQRAIRGCAEVIDGGNSDTKGLPDADRALKLNPKCANCWDTRGHIYEALGRKREAIGDFRRALKLDPNLEESRAGLRRLGVSAK